VVTERAGAAGRFILVVGWLFLVAAALGLFISAGQVVLLSQAAPGFAVDAGARALAMGLAVASAIVAVVSRSFLRRRLWAHRALAVIAALGMVASLLRLLLPASAVEPPPDSPGEYVQLLPLVSIAEVVVPLVACLALGWILWRLRSPAVRDQFH
jgi:hypothetical protein